MQTICSALRLLGLTHKFKVKKNDARDTEGTAVWMSVDTSTYYIRNQSTLSHLLFTQVHIPGIIEFVCVEVFIRLMAVVLGLMILVFFFYIQSINLDANKFKFHLFLHCSC